ncbi:Alpha/Beta hydrolase protein [Mycena galericulata]|nr:Alpha/Beta hydrolase protein [Mycena galericulata]
MSLLPISLGLISIIAPAYSLSVPLDRRDANQTIRWLDCTSRIPTTMQEEFNVTASTPIPSTLRCGELDVPMDYTKPFDATTNNITIGFAMNRPENAEGVILYHAGGPGIDAASQAWQNALNLSTTFDTLLDNFDILAINMRGLEFSNPLNCTSGAFFNNISYPFPTSEDEYTAYQASMTNFIQSCVNNSSPAGIVQFVSTNDFIQDMDSVRAALGYETVHFAGVSYGTFVGAAYAARYPQRVGRFVIDAVIPHGMAFGPMIDDQMTAINRLLERSDAFCLTDPTCPFYGQGKGSVVKAWNTLLAQAIQEPLAAPGCTPATGCLNPVTATDVRFAVHATFRSNPDFPLFNYALNQSLHGNATLFGYIPAEDIRETVVSPLLCSDFPIEDSWKTFEGFNSFSVNAQPNDTNSVIYSQTWQFVLMCAAWPYPVANQTTLPNDLNIMWVTSDFDLNLPTELTTFAWQQTPNATLVIRHGDDHISIDLSGPSGAAADLAKGFLKTGVMPGAQNNTQVTVIPPGGTRGPVPSPYDVPTGAEAADISIIENITTTSGPGSNITASGATSHTGAAVSIHTRSLSCVFGFLLFIAALSVV